MIAGITTGSKQLRIIGIDPGTTAAVAVLDLEGNLVDYKSTKNFSKDQIIQFIISHGKPLILGTDVSPLPSLLEDIASNMGAIRSVPSEDLQSAYKDRLTDRFDVDRADAHAIDAIAAAEYAYREYGDRIDTVRHRAEQEDLDAGQTRAVIETVLKQGVSTEGAIRQVQEPDDDTGPDNPDANSMDPGQESHQENWQQIAENRKQKIDLLEDKIAHLEEHLQTLEHDSGSEPAVGEDELRKRNREINTLRSKLDQKRTQVKQLQDRNEDLETAIHRILDSDWVFVPVVDSLAETEHDIVYCDTYSGGEVSSTVDTVITTDSLDETPAYQSLADRGVQVIALSALDDPVELDDGYVVNTEEVLRTGESEKFMEWLESYKERQTL